MNYRKAETRDLPFVLDCILESERSGGEFTVWEKLLGLDTEKFKRLLENILEEEIEGQEWNLSQFRVLTDGEKPIAGLSCWIEGDQGQGSGILKSQAISWFYPEEWRAAAEDLKKIVGIQVPRIPGALQLENIYTEPVHRGQGLVVRLIEKTLEEYRNSPQPPNLAEIQLMAENTSALRSYTKCGFVKHLQSPESDEGILNLLPGRSRVSLIRQI